MRRQLSMLPITALVIALGVAGCRQGPENEAPPDAIDEQAAAASDGAIAPEDESAPIAEAEPAEPIARPSSSGLAPVAPPPASATARPTTRPPATGVEPGRVVTPSPSIGGTPERAAVDTPTRAPEPATPALARLIELPRGTALPLRLSTALASDTSDVEDPVSARVTRDVEVDGQVVVPEGSTVAGRVTYAKGSAKVKGRAGLTVRFYTLTVGERSYDIDAEPLRREAAGSKGKDAQKIGIGAGAGAVIGGLLGGRKGAAIGAVAGGAGGTGVVLATKGEEVELPAGTAVTLTLTSPLAVAAR